MRGRLVAGTMWSVAMRWSLRGLGLISTLVLARLLTPEDFGLVAMALSAQAFVDLFFFMGIELVLLRDKNAGEKDFNLAWSLRLVQASLAAVAVAALAPVGAAWFDEPAIALLMPVTALAMLVRGVENIGIVAFQKQLDFAADFRMFTISKAISVAVTIALAFWLRNFWALVLGGLAAAAIRTAMSYAMHPFRPRFTLVGARRMLGFSLWLFLGNIGKYANGGADRLVLGSLAPAAALGQYTVGKEIGETVINEISLPAGRVLMPGFAMLRDDARRLEEALGKALGAILAVSIPAAVGMAAVAGRAVPAAIGPQWDAAIPLVGPLAAIGALVSFQAMLERYLLVRGEERFLAFYMLALGLATVGGLIAGFRFGDLLGACLAMLGVRALATVVFGTIVASRSGLRRATLFVPFVRPLAASAAMAGAVLALDEAMGEAIWLPLLAQIACGVVSYVLALWLLWRAAGRPDGIEGIAFGSLGRALRRVAGGQSRPPR